MNTKKTTTIVNIILDKSGSMSDCLEGTISGFNEYIKNLNKKKGKILLSLTTFNSLVNKEYSLVPLKNIKKLNVETYRPDGMTALYDAVIDTIEYVAKQVDQMRESKPAVLTVIMTDGEENSSVKHDRDCLNDLINKLKADGNWSFIFLGANQDSWGNARNLGFDSGNVANFQASNRGMQSSFNAMYTATSNVMAMADSGKGLASANLLAGLKAEDTNELT